MPARSTMRSSTSTDVDIVLPASRCPAAIEHGNEYITGIRESVPVSASQNRSSTSSRSADAVPTPISTIPCASPSTVCDVELMLTIIHRMRFTDDESSIHALSVFAGTSPGSIATPVVSEALAPYVVAFPRPIPEKPLEIHRTATDIVFPDAVL